jgi:hypothetical protein
LEQDFNVEEYEYRTEEMFEVTFFETSLNYNYYFYSAFGLFVLKKTYLQRILRISKGTARL